MAGARCDPACSIVGVDIPGGVRPG